MHDLPAGKGSNQIDAGAVSRRLFVKVGTMAGLFAGFLVNPIGAFAGQQAGQRGGRDLANDHNLPKKKYRDSVFYLSRSRFTPHLGAQFSVKTDDGQSLYLNLYRIEDLKYPPDMSDRDLQREKEVSFSLLYFGPPDQPLRQQLCTFTHPDFDPFKVLIVPVGSDANVRFYEIVLNRLNPEFTRISK